MKKYKKKWQIIVLIVSMFAVTGCNILNWQGNAKIVSNRNKSQEESAEKSALEEDRKGIVYFSQIGFERQDQKLLFIKAKEVLSDFQIIDIDTNQVVLMESLKLLKETPEGYWYYGDFSDLKQEGKFRVAGDGIGESMSFSVDDAVYEKMIQKYRTVLKENFPKTVGKKVECLGYLLLAEEMFQKQLRDENFLKLQMEEILEQLETSNYMKENGSYLATVDVAKAVGVLAQAAYFLKDEKTGTKDSDAYELADRCQRDSEKLYHVLFPEREQIPCDIWYYASTALFRLTGSYEYKRNIKEIDALEDCEKIQSQFNYNFLADFIYLLTPVVADYQRCEKIFKGYLQEALQISMAAERENFYVGEEIFEKKQEDLLEELMLLGIINHSLSSREYEGVQKNYMHYLAGRNPENYNYFKDEDWLSEQDSSNISRMLFILASICKE